METQNTEYKRLWKDDFLKEICAFANAQGGTLYTGIDDNGHIVGVNEAKNKPRNLNIASVFYKAGFIEAWGRGYKKIQDGFNAAHLPMPVFATAFGGVEVTITRTKAIESGGQNGGQNAEQLTERQHLILATIEKHGGHVGGQNGGQKAGLNNEDLVKLLGISLRTIEREVVVLKKKNLIRRIGYGLKGYWAII